MPFAITLRLDDATAGQVSALWQTLAAAGLSDDSLRLGYRPHVTLAICPDETPESPLHDATAHVARGRDWLKLCLASLGVFTTQPGVVFLAPIVTPALLDLHAVAMEALSGVPVSPNYHPGAWMPHVTLAKDLVAPADAIRALEALTLPIHGRLDRVELVRFRPVQVLASHALPAG
ncbi:MAG: 2'-5' RNA ligase family protein [Acetobacteraceae bacterium]|nr:2'-5' RNA ligase family protein [Acetobacteraceae bacterium]